LAPSTRDARAQGESEERLYLLDAWRESPLYSDRERAALVWTESVTLVAETRVPDDVCDEARRHFSEKGLTDLTTAGGDQRLEPVHGRHPRDASGGEGESGVTAPRTLTPPAASPAPARSAS
jgi:hypothetical protein